MQCSSASTACAHASPPSGIFRTLPGWFLTVNSTIDTFTFKKWSRGGKNSPTWSFYSLFDEVFIRVSSLGFQPWNPGYWRGLLTFHVQAVPSSSLVVDGPKVCKFLFNRIWCDYFLSQSHLGCSCIVQTGFRIWSTWHDAIIPNMMICMRVHKDPFHVTSIFFTFLKSTKLVSLRAFESQQ